MSKTICRRDMAGFLHSTQPMIIRAGVAKGLSSDTAAVFHSALRQKHKLRPLIEDAGHDKKDLIALERT